MKGSGLVYIEAMRHAIPVVASVHDAAPEIVLDGHTGYAVDLDVPNELPEWLVSLLRGPDHASAFGRSGRKRWLESFSYDAFKARFLPMLREFLSVSG